MPIHDADGFPRARREARPVFSAAEAAAQYVARTADLAEALVRDLLRDDGRLRGCALDGPAIAAEVEQLRYLRGRAPLSARIDAGETWLQHDVGQRLLDDGLGEGAVRLALEVFAALRRLTRPKAKRRPWRRRSAAVAA